MRELIVNVVTTLLTCIITNSVFDVFDFHYSVFENGFNLLLFSIDYGTYIVIFLLIFIVLTKLFVKETNY